MQTVEKETANSKQYYYDLFGLELGAVLQIRGHGEDAVTFSNSDCPGHCQGKASCP